MRCEEFWERLNSCFSDPQDMDECLEEHLSDCPVCKMEMENLQLSAII